MLAAMGAKVTEADLIARNLMQPGQPVYDQVVRVFGQKILQPDGAIDRKKLADVAFGAASGSNPHPIQRVGELNAIVHPAVAREQEAWLAGMGKADPEAVAVVEAALIFEAGLQHQFDRIVVATCPLETRVRRWMARSGTDEAAARRELERRMAAQWPEEKKIAAGDFVLDNSGTERETESKVRELLGKLEVEARDHPG